MLKGTPPETQGLELTQSWHLNSLFFLGLFYVLILDALCCWEAEVFRIPAMGQLGSQCLQCSERPKELLLQTAPEERSLNGIF